MTSLIGKIIDFISKPLNTTILAGIFLTSGFIFIFNFLPEEILIRMNLLTFLNDYNYIVFISLVASFFLLIIQGITMIFKREKDKKFNKYIKKNQEELFNDEEAYKVLEFMYQRHPEQTNLPIQNQKVMLLHQFGLITRVSDGIYVEGAQNLNDPYFPFVLQPVAEKRLKELNE